MTKIEMAVNGLCQWPQGASEFNPKVDDLIETCPYRASAYEDEVRLTELGLKNYKEEKIGEGKFTHQHVVCVYWCGHPEKEDMSLCPDEIVKSQMLQETEENR